MLVLQQLFYLLVLYKANGKLQNSFRSTVVRRKDIQKRFLPRYNKSPCNLQAEQIDGGSNRLVVFFIVFFLINKMFLLSNIK